MGGERESILVCQWASTLGTMRRFPKCMSLVSMRWKIPRPNPKWKIPRPYPKWEIPRPYPKTPRPNLKVPRPNLKIPRPNPKIPRLNLKIQTPVMMRRRVAPVFIQATVTFVSGWLCRGCVAVTLVKKMLTSDCPLEDHCVSWNECIVNCCTLLVWVYKLIYVLNK